MNCVTITNYDQVPNKVPNVKTEKALIDLTNTFAAKQNTVV